MNAGTLSDARPAESFERQDVVRWLGDSVVDKGAEILRRISQLSILPRRITAAVEGGQRLPYRVEIVFIPAGGRHWHLRASCSCPAGSFCKHTAAAMLAAIEHRRATPGVKPEVLAWAARLREMADARADAPTRPKRATHRLDYVLEFSPYYHRWQVGFLKSGLNAHGEPNGRREPWLSVERALLQPPSFIDESDLAILRLLWMQEKSRYSGLSLAGRHSGEIIRRIADSGRLLLKFNDEELIPLAAAAPRHARFAWRIGDNGVAPRFIADEGEIRLVLPCDPPWYVDPARRCLGPLETELPADLVGCLLDLPPLSDDDLPVVASALALAAPTVPLPDPDLGRRLRTIDTPPTPVLTIGCHEAFSIRAHRGYPASYGKVLYDYAQVSFRYGEATLESGSNREFVNLPDGETVRIVRRPDAENQRLDELKAIGFAATPAQVVQSYTRSRPTPMLGLASEDAWEDFCTGQLPNLRAGGWEVILPAGFRHHVLEVDGWHAEFVESENGWFDVDLGIDVDGQRLPLSPLLFALFRQDPRWLASEALARIADDEPIELDGPTGIRIRIAAGRLKPLAATLIELFDATGDGKLRVAALDAPRLIDATSGWQTSGEELARSIAERLKGCLAPVAIDPPADFAGTLRPYQREGLGWLQYLRQNDLAGILADDMGLGKTAQALAHLLTEKAAGRLAANGNGPALIVLPTSLIFNWKREAAHFAPGLRVLSLHGPDRKARFAGIPEHDVILTTYPLLWRDEKELARYAYHLLILDEAQTVKNAASRAADVVRGIRAGHRLCITGTPLENHLGELWAQFDFLIPGLLGDARTFTRLWRSPIEKLGDAGRRALLARRVRPFILRRRKEDVASELPPKTIIVRNVELEGGQRDLYETVRSTMDKRVREEIAQRGFARSQIVILDALLKLRQVCCDPRLLKAEAAKAVKERAKLDLLLDMLPELVAEGRRILLFSQFTSMLALIEKELARLKLPYVLLTGDTVDRETPIGRFQAGEVPLFLISLKAGGVGLNLTAADTVIHYDPWWNPAVENQATDRAHRIGQTKPVFVYKLVVAGSIEEKIIGLQERKAELAAGVLGEDAAGIAKFGESELAALLEPLAPLAGKD